MPFKMLREFLQLESAAGIMLIVSAALALITVNSPMGWLYSQALGTNLTVELGGYGIDKPILLWINDGLMAFFFLLVGLEIKREMLRGQLSTREQAILPAVAAFGGLIVPALIFVSINWNNPENIRGWAIPSATDIAFALGVISLLGKRVPEPLKVCLVALAIIDDLAAIVIVALFYTAQVHGIYLLMAVVALIALVIFNRRGVNALAPYLAVGLALWFFLLKSGVHATLAGVTIALTIPIRGRGESKASPLHSLEHSLHPWVAFGILPVFAFANSGLPLSGISPGSLLEPVTLGIGTGLFVGKQVGVMVATTMAVAAGLCSLPPGVNWRQYYGMAVVTGIGFTMSLFIGNLAFTDASMSGVIRLGVIGGSLLSGVVGYLVLLLSSHPRSKTD